ncbi:hydroxyethylthiazole kinase [Kurthia sibirica]|uniref:Hydroxyethylthiazole kinase n=1 Tax=Kurthia sibirica TaxID=202750 RepID=A0A2U3AN81_9BACL|nr:hydroxyethylthiazole kinase [Kurthia sibirica]PWI25975.1 hydroxyethylthiazole kinase [Kurthia sibirica]GEK34992.1 hydroxyethylthiazole kinase [Kurthia sibirica]
MTWDTIRAKKPIVHCITNYVVANFTANALLALHASPIMADELLEVEDVTTLSDGLLLNIGTLNERTVKSMLVAGKKANDLHKFVVLDPVGCGASAYRKLVTQQLVQEIQFSMIRCNAGELAALSNIDNMSRGVDAGDVNYNITAAAEALAIQYQCIVAVSGEVDIITDGLATSQVTGGHRWMEQVTGAGCLLSALCVAVLASSPANPLQAIVALHKDYKKMAEQAALTSPALGDFHYSLLNQLHLGVN